MKKLCVLLLINILILVLNACGETSTGIDMKAKDIILYSPEGDGRKIYSLTIPENYISSATPNETVILKTIYPEMLGFSPELRDRFFNENGSGGTDKIKIFLKV